MKLLGYKVLKCYIIFDLIKIDRLEYCVWHPNVPLDQLRIQFTNLKKYNFELYKLEWGKDELKCTVCLLLFAFAIEKLKDRGPVQFVVLVIQ